MSVRLGTIRNVQGNLIRIMPRNGSCDGCIFNSIEACLEIKLSNVKSNAVQEIDCTTEGVKFVKP